MPATENASSSAGCATCGTAADMSTGPPEAINTSTVPIASQTGVVDEFGSAGSLLGMYWYIPVIIVVFVVILVVVL